MLKRIALPLVLVTTVVSQAIAENWPAWRGLQGNGVTTETDLPVKWDSRKNVAWKAPLPGAGNSVPIVWNDRVFVTCPINKGKIRSLICFDRATGRQLWRKDVPYPAKETTHRDNPFCSGSPTTDGKRVYVSFGSAGVLAYDFSGKVVWHRKLGKLTHVFGQATTPVLYKNLVIVHRGPGVPTHIVALDKATGKTVWNRPQRGKNDNLFGSWSTPVIVKSGDRDVMLLSLPEQIKAFDPMTGKDLWSSDGLGTEVYTMPAVGKDAVGHDVVVGISGHKGPAMAVRLGGRGDVTKTHRIWRVPRNGQRVGSAVIHKGYLFVSNAVGTAECVDVKSGKTVWRKRLGGTLWGSMLLSGERLYVGNQQGQFFVLAASPKYRLIAKNEMKEHAKAALAPSDGQLFIRTYRNLYCIGKRNQRPRNTRQSRSGSRLFRNDVFTSGKNGYHTYRIPALIVTRNGTLLAFCEGRKTGRSDHGDLDLLLRRSTDRGNTWSKQQIVYEEGGVKKITIGNPCPVVDQMTGRIWLPFCRDNKDVFVTCSDDDGKTWAKPRRITANVKKPGWGWYATGPGVGIQLKRGKHNGRLVIPCDHRASGDRRGATFSHVVFSDDHGKTWKLGGTVARHTNECQVAELDDGTLMINMRNYWGRDGKQKDRDRMRAVAISRDGGETWRQLRFDSTLMEPICQASFLRYEATRDAGRNRLLFSNPASKTTRHRLTVRLSNDGGKTWPVGRLLHAGPSAYSCLSVLPDGSIGCLYEGGGKHAYERIIFARFPSNWLTGGNGRTAHKRKVRTVTNSIGMKFSLIPAGEFRMGSAKTQRDALGATHSARCTR